MADLNLNLGDANAINGSLNVTNNVVERNKSRDEIVLEQENKYRLQCREFLADGKISAEERTVLDKSGAELGIDKARQQQILKSEIEICKTKSLTLDKSSSVLFLHFVKKLKAYDVQGMLKLYPRLQIMEAGFSDSMVKFYYFLLTSIVRPTECIQRYESHKEDSYWLTYWSVLAYAMKGLTNKSEKAKNQLSAWSEYDEENSILLDMAVAIMDNDWDLADAFRDALEGNYADELAAFASTIFTLINNKDDLGNIAYDLEQMIYIDGFFYRQTTRLGLGVLLPNGILIGSANVSSEAVDLNALQMEHHSESKAVEEKRKEIDDAWRNTFEEELKPKIEFARTYIDQLRKFKDKKKEAALKAYAHRNDSEAAAAENDKLWDEYNEIVRLIDGEGVTTMEEIQSMVIEQIKQQK